MCPCAYENMVEIGRITSAVGLSGEVRVYSYSDSEDRFETLGTVYVDGDAREIERVRYSKGMAVIKLSGADDRNAAEALRGKTLYMAEEDLEELPEGTYYVRDLIGMEVREADGTPLGRVTDVLTHTAQALYEVELENGKKILIPNAGGFIQDIDTENGVIRAALPEGLKDLQI